MTMEGLGYLSALVMGLTLGLIGGGGSILTVPILVYCFQMDAVLATAYSLFVVGATSLVGSMGHLRSGHVNWRVAIVFGVPSILAVFATRTWLLPAIPDHLLTLGSFVIHRPEAILLFFAVLMLGAAYSMIRQPPLATGTVKTGVPSVPLNHALVLGEGLLVGLVTGIVGAGGGFLIVPALTLLAKLPMEQAIGTSLIIIAAKSLIGFLGDMSGDEAIDFTFLFTFSAIAGVGALAGSHLMKGLPKEKLKPAFGYFVLLMGIYIIGRELAHLG
jgi:uncharacterized protein